VEKPWNSAKELEEFPNESQKL